MRELSVTFYKYLSLHSLLIGIFPFFLPVYLWTHGLSLAKISIFIGLSGFAFCAALWVWDHIRQSISLLRLVAISLVLEIVLLLAVKTLDLGSYGLTLLALSYGAYNCFFWTTQRALFFERVNSSNSGRNYGNMQMYVGLVLQVGILIGGLLLEKLGFNYVLACSAAVAVLGYAVLAAGDVNAPEAWNQSPPLGVGEILGFNDEHASKLIFLVDGLYLFLESFFWVISLFLIAHESFLTLGLVVISLALIFGVIFYLLKNMIDRLDRWKIYRIAVALYALSWVMRANVGQGMDLMFLFLALVLITFCTSFFRLAMNKRFYDLAGETLNHRYLVLKSYYSQVGIGIVFVGFGLMMTDDIAAAKILSLSYWLAAGLAFSYLCYGAAYAKAGKLAAKATST